MVPQILGTEIKDRNCVARRDNVKEIANVAVSKESKRTALKGSQKDDVRKVTRAASVTTEKRKGKGETSNTISLPRLKPILQRRRQRYQRQRTQRYRPMWRKIPASLLQEHVGKGYELFL